MEHKSMRNVSSSNVPLNTMERRQDTSTQGREDISESQALRPGVTSPEDKETECISRCKELHAALITLIWLFLFFTDGRYFSCAFSHWGGEYTETGALKWCRPMGNKTLVFERLQETQKWIFISQDFPTASDLLAVRHAVGIIHAVILALMPALVLHDGTAACLVLAAFENILDQEFVCPCDYTYNIVLCVLYGAVPSIGFFVFTYCYMDGYSEMENGRIRDLLMSDKLLYSTLTTIIWVSLFFVDGRYLACAFSVWGGVYAKNETLGIVKWCKATGNETDVFKSQQDTLKWITRSQEKKRKKIECNETCTCPRFCYTIISVLIWLMLLLMDGRYVACGSSNWDGVYTKTDNLALTQWCRPNNESSVPEKELRIVTAVFWSQVVGSSLIVVIAILLFCFFFAFNNDENQAVDSVEMEAFPTFSIFVYTFCYMGKFEETNNRATERNTSNSTQTEDKTTSNFCTCKNVLNSIFACVIWLCIFLLDGRYLACAFSTWEGVYAKNESLMILKWCKPTGNKTSVLESQQKTLKWMSRSQILGFILILLTTCFFLLLPCCCKQREQKPETQQGQQPETQQVQQPKSQQKHQPETQKEHQPETQQEHQSETQHGQKQGTQQGQQPGTQQEQQPETQQEHQPETQQGQQPETQQGQQPGTQQGQQPGTQQEHQPETQQKHQPETQQGQQPGTQQGQQPETQQEHQPETQQGQQPGTQQGQQPGTQQGQQPETQQEHQPETQQGQQPGTQQGQQPETQQDQKPLTQREQQEQQEATIKNNNRNNNNHRHTRESNKYNWNNRNNNSMNTSNKGQPQKQQQQINETKINITISNQ
ncbi:protein FAM26F-like [Silurus asotus]|uniref:Protein FAM26F-like n=1 Tax=Silurus asotus TaxID=30991 RepID=A0AAD5B7Y2_SILAS|nr:protein FAM26F-like [Silurus asotus]